MERSLPVTVRQLRVVEHVMNRGRLEKLVLEGKIKGRRQRGRQRLKYLEGLAFAAGYDAVDFLWWASDHAGFRHMVINVRH